MSDRGAGLASRSDSRSGQSFGWVLCHRGSCVVCANPGLVGNLGTERRPTQADDFSAFGMPQLYRGGARKSLASAHCSDAAKWKHKTMKSKTRNRAVPSSQKSERNSAWQMANDNTKGSNALEQSVAVPLRNFSVSESYAQNISRNLVDLSSSS